MTYKMFIDDERFPPDDGGNWKIARSMYDVHDLISKHWMPTFMSFDHDLGEGRETGMDIAKWLVEYDLSYNAIPEGFDFYVHSQNPVGAENIRQLLTSYLAYKAKG